MGGQVNTNTTHGQTNFDGSILSVQQASIKSGFSIALWQFTTSSNNTVGHGLGVAPDMMIIKSRTTAYNWDVYHKDLTDATKRLNLNTTGAETSGFFVTDPTSTIFTYASNALSNNDNAIAYCFSEVEGFSKYGTYTGNGSATDGAYIFTGFSVAWVMVKRTNSTGSWTIYDNKRNTFNPRSIRLVPNLSNAEADTSTQAVDFLSNGFKLMSNNTDQNGSGSTYIYMAFAEQPFKFSNAR